MRLANIDYSILQSTYMDSEEIMDVSLIRELQSSPLDLLDGSEELLLIRTCQDGVVGV